MPMSLDHINLWLLQDEDGWTVVDTCLNLPGARATWEQLFAGFMQGKPVRRVICTHLHPDHVGLAGWLTERFDCELWMPREEFLMCRAMTADTGRPAPDMAIRFYRAAGYNEATVGTLQKYLWQLWPGDRPPAGQFPPPRRPRNHSPSATVTGRSSSAAVIHPNMPRCTAPPLKLLISGDQVLPRITPNVSVFPTEPQGDPLNEWLRSSARLGEILPDDLLVLPAHEAPFYGLHTRLNQIIESHKSGLASLFNHLAQPRRAVDCFPALFNREIGEGSMGLAIGETLAHLNCLLGSRRITRTADAQGVNWYQQNPATSDYD